MFILIFAACEEKDDGPNPGEIVNISDTAFLSALIDIGIDTDGDGIISYAEAEAIDSLDVGDEWGTSRGITNITGIEAFINLEYLRCCNDIKFLDISKNTKLTHLSCRNCGLTELNVSTNLELKYLNCAFNDIKELDISKNTKLTHLDTRGAAFISSPLGYLETLDISNNVLLEYLDCCCQNLKSLDLSKNTALIYLDCGGNKELTSLDVSKNVALEELICVWNGFTTLDLSNNTNLRTLNLKDNPFLWEGNGINEINLSYNNKLTNINLENMPSLTKVCVWTIPFPPAEVEVQTEGSPDVEFTTDCSK